MNDIIVGLSDINRSKTLSSFQIEEMKIGEDVYRGFTSIVLCRHATYQQKTQVFGYIAPTVGFSSKGSGATFGAGGAISSQNESVITVVYVNSSGIEATTELPASVSALDGTLLRLDFINNSLVAATNLSGKQAPRILLGPGSFLEQIRWSWFYAVSAIIAMLCQSEPILFILFLTPLAIFIYRRVKRNREREQLAEYMNRVLAQPI